MRRHTSSRGKVTPSSRQSYRGQGGGLSHRPDRAFSTERMRRWRLFSSPPVRVTPVFSRSRAYSSSVVFPSSSARRAGSGRASVKVKPSVTARTYSPVPPTRKGVLPRARISSMAA